MIQLLDTFGWGNYSPAINFMLMPIYFDVQKIQSIEFNDQIRKSAYTFELVNNKLKIFLWSLFAQKNKQSKSRLKDTNSEQTKD